MYISDLPWSSYYSGDWRENSEKGLAKRVVGDLVVPFTGVNRVVYCDSFYSSGPLVEMLASEHIICQYY